MTGLSARWYAPLVCRSNLLMVFACALALTATAHARECGDFPDRDRVPCACGDTVVTDTVLSPGDPIVSGRCSFDGLRLRASALAETIKLDLAGLAIVGTGAGVGLQVDRGGSEGALVTGGEGAPAS